MCGQRERTASTSAILVAEFIIAAMQMRPDSSWSATRKNLSRALLTAEVKVPSRSTWVRSPASLSTRGCQRALYCGARGEGADDGGRRVSPRTSEKEFSSASRGTRTCSNHSLPLSTPLQPILWPMSSIRTPRSTEPLSSERIRVKKPCGPYLRGRPRPPPLAASQKHCIDCLSVVFKQGNFLHEISGSDGSCALAPCPGSSCRPCGSSSPR